MYMYFQIHHYHLGTEKVLFKTRNKCIECAHPLSTNGAYTHTESESESAKYSKHLINRVLHGAPIIEVIFLRNLRREASARLINAERQAG